MNQRYFSSLLAVFLTTASMLNGQANYTFSFNYGGYNRNYIVHLPPAYTQGVSLPLVFNLHGYTSEALQQQVYSGMDAIADTGNFIVVYPNGINNAWNSFLYPGTGLPDDVGFVSAVIDSMYYRYNIDLSRVYACGMSNGGYMSYRLACELSNRIAAIASVTGLLAPDILANCAPSRIVPVMQVHGTNDLTVPYNGAPGYGSVDETIAYWVANDSCNPSPSMQSLPNTNTSDNSTVELYTYTGISPHSKVLLYKVLNGSHTWPGAPFDLPALVTNKDINTSSEIWNFFKQFQHENPLQVTGIDNVNQSELKFYPNPFSNEIAVEAKGDELQSITLYNLLGSKVLEEKISGQSANINTTTLGKGLYLLLVETSRGSQSFKVVK
ncbi:MAG: T9SS type A sorting domain-containing protein [Chitinophagales bacterium]|nr:T9SS type A sorting domain-containing protein [Chitinophagales bacterium]